MRDARALAGPPIAAIGPGTARALREHGIEPDVVPARSVAEGLVEALADDAGRAARWSCAPRRRRDVLPDALRARGAEVDVLALYRTVAEPLGDERARRGARRRLRSPSPRPRRRASSTRPRGTLAGPRLVSIGPATSAALRELGLEPDVEAAEHTPDGLVAALLADASGTVAG